MAPDYRYHLLDVFTDAVFGGNGLAVFLDGRGIADATMQRIARELNLSETVFVLPPSSPGATHHTRIFTPGRELPYAGHPTIGTACLLALRGDVTLRDGAGRVVFQQGVGNVPVEVRVADGAAPFAQLTAARPPEIRPSPLDRAALAALLSLDPDDVLDDPAHAPAAASTGGPFLFVALRDRAALARTVLDLARWSRELAGTWAPQVFVYAFDPERPGSDLRGRMFAPEMGILEDPATGSAATALAGLLATRAGRDGVHRWRLEQGFEMGRPSILELEAEVVRGSVTATRVGGNAVLVGSGELAL